MAIQQLPTGRFDTWSFASFRDSLKKELDDDRDGEQLKLFFYAVTTSGWNEVEASITAWVSAKRGRTCTLYAGTDHALTDPNALEEMSVAGIHVRVMETYRGVFHPKAAWLSSANGHRIWVGSNNLTKQGLSQNIEFGATFTFRRIPRDLRTWAEAVHSGSTELTDEILASYRRQRAAFERKRADSGSLTFTWRRRKEPSSATTAPHLSPGSGDLIIEIMPKETGSGGSQVQIPLAAARSFFGVRKGSASRRINLRPVGVHQSKTLTMTIFANNTIRLSLAELGYRDRPCLVVFRKRRASVFEYEVVSQSVFPTRYKALLKLCVNRTRQGSRGWGIVS